MTPVEPTPDTSAVQAALDAGQPVYVLVDPLGGEPLPIDPREAVDASWLAAERARVWQRDVHPVALDSSIELPPAFHPYLVALDGLADEWLAQSVSLAHAQRLSSQRGGLAGDGTAPHGIGGWLQSGRSPDAVARQLAELMRVRSRVATRPRYQRLADSRVLGWLRHVVGDAALAPALHPIRERPAAPS